MVELTHHLKAGQRHQSGSDLNAPEDIHIELYVFKCDIWCMILRIHCVIMCDGKMGGALSLPHFSSFSYFCWNLIEVWLELKLSFLPAHPPPFQSPPHPPVSWTTNMWSHRITIHITTRGLYLMPETLASELKHSSSPVRRNETGNGSSQKERTHG